MARGGGTDPYLYPGTDVLRNKLGIRDNQALRLTEYAFTRIRGQHTPVLPMTVKGYLAAHRHLFQDVYEWAGKVRTVTLAKGASMFAFPQAVEPSLRTRFADLAAKGFLRGLHPDGFAAGAAHHVSELNAIHPFRVMLNCKLTSREWSRFDRLRLGLPQLSPRTNLGFYKVV